MTCSSCGAENVTGRRFCDECGTALAIACPSCGEPNRPGARFCGSCGTAFTATAGASGSARPPGSPPTPAPGVAGEARAGISAAGPGEHSGAERRLVSVLFADLVGFTPFSEERDAESVREVLTRYFEAASEVVARYGGTVEKFIGDAVMAVWGTPTAHEDDAERAVRAALDIVDAVSRLEAGIQARAGVMTGEAAVTLAATNQGMVAGDLVNTAARVQAVAAASTVLVGEATMRASSSAIAFEPAGEQSLKGKGSPIPVWRAVRVVAQRGGQGRSDLPEPPFVGREEELRTLKDLITSTGRDRRARLVSITGPGGIGKSRLAWELNKYIDGIVESIYWHRGRSPAYGDGITFWALGEMVRRRAGLAESDDEATTRARIRSTVGEYVPADDDRRWVEPALLTLLGLEPAPAGGRDVLFAAWRIFFERIADRGTVVLLFEDLQWADTGLLEFLDHLLEWSRASPILVITLARPELFDRRPDWGAGTRNLTALALEPLSDSAMRELLAGLVPGLPDGATTAILSRADGMPLYAVEMIRALLADGRLERVGDGYRPADDLRDLAIPDTLRSLIASRLDALDPVDRSLVQDGAVLGQTFSLVALAAVSSRDPSELDGRVRALVRREILQLEVDPRSPERGQYGFVQGLIREVAYGTLARRERRSRHLAVARHFESLGDEEMAGALAAHYLEAHAASAEGAEADAVAIQARLALSAAAERAATLGAHDQAVSYLRQALGVTTDPGERIEILLRAASSANRAADYRVAESLAREAVEACASSSNRVVAGRAQALLGEILIDAGNSQDAVLALDDAVRSLGDAAPPEARAPVLASLSRALMRVGACDRALVVADEALALAERLGNELVVAEAFNNKASCLSYVGRRREAIAIMTAAVELARRGGYVGAELRALGNLGSVLAGEDPGRFNELNEEALQLARRVGNRTMAAWFIGNQVWGQYVLARDWDVAMTTAEEFLAGEPPPVDQLRMISIGAMHRVARGENTDDALQSLERLSTQLSDPFAAAALHAIRADRTFQAGEFAASHEAFIAAADSGGAGFASTYLILAIRSALWGQDVDRARTTSARLDAEDSTDAVTNADRAAARAGLAALEGRTADAVASYRIALDQYRAVGLDWGLATAALDFAHLVGPDEPAAAAAAAEARAIFERVGARPYLERLDAAVRRSEPASSLGRQALTDADRQESPPVPSA